MIWKRLRHFETQEVVFACRFSFTYNDKQYVYIRGIESHRSVGTLQKLRTTDSTIIETLATQELIPALEVISVKPQGFHRLLQGIKFAELQMHLCSSFDFACLAIKKIGQKSKLQVVGQSTHLFARELETALYSGRQSAHSTHQPTRPSLQDIANFEINGNEHDLANQIRIFNCLPPILSMPVTATHNVPLCCHSDLQSIRSVVLNGTRPFEVNAALEKFITPSPNRPAKRKRATVTPEYGFPDNIAPPEPKSPSHRRLEPAAPLVMDKDDVFFSHLVSNGLVRCIDKSGGKLTFVWNGMFSPMRCFCLWSLMFFSPQIVAQALQSFASTTSL
jgi:hypothetical protein